MTRYILALILAIGFALPMAHAQRGGPASVFVEDVTPYAFSTRIEALGTLEPSEMVDLTLNAADRVTAIYFDDGERVRRGKTLLSLAQREQVALVESAEAEVEEARRQLERVTRLADQNAVSQSERDTAQRNLDTAEAQLRAVQSRQRDRVLVAPFDGVLGFRQVSVGSFVRPGDIVATLIDDSELNLDFAVPSTFLRALQPGVEIEAVTDDIPGEIFVGQVATLDNRIDPVTRAVRVRAILPNPELLLRPGMFMKVTLIADPRIAPSIPEETVQPVGPDSFVFVVDYSEEPPVARRVQVELGARQDGRVEVLAGLEGGQQVITEGIIRVRDGAPVVIRSQSILQPTSQAGGGGGGRPAGAMSGPGR